MIYLVCALIPIIFFMILILLGYIDSKVDYSKKSIYFYFYNDNGFYIRVPCLIWQYNKYQAIQSRFSEVIEYENRKYTVTAVMNSQPHLSLPSDILPGFLYKDFIANVEYTPNPIPRTITNNTQVIGNNNTVIIEQNETHITKITTYINKLLAENIDDVDKQCLELFNYKLSQHAITPNDTNRVVDVLNKLAKCAPYASLASATINLIKSVLP